MNPLLASDEIPGLPITSLLSATPLAAIWNRALWGQTLEDAVSKPLQVVYSVVPSIWTQVRRADRGWVGSGEITYDCRTEGRSGESLNVGIGVK